MAKRNHLEALSSDEQLRIVLKDAEPVIASLHDCRAFSSVAKALPDTDMWDLSNLLIDGQHVRRQTVLRWLSALMQLTEDQQPATESQTCTAASLYELLAFADAVGSRRGLVMACISNLPGLELQLTDQKQQLLGLPIEVGTFSFFNIKTDEEAVEGAADVNQRYYLYHELLLAESKNAVLANDLNQQGRDSIAAQVAQQLEQLLFISYKLNLEPLIDRLHHIIRQNTMDNSYIVQQRSDAILFSQRVLSALSMSSHARKIWSNSLCGEHCALGPGSSSAPFVPADPKEAPQPIKFRAVLQRDFMGRCKGTAVHVTMDLVGGEITLDSAETAQGEIERCNVDSNWFSFELRITDRSLTTSQLQD